MDSGDASFKVKSRKAWSDFVKKLGKNCGILKAMCTFSYYLRKFFDPNFKVLN